MTKPNCKVWIALLLFLCLHVTACGTQTSTNIETEIQTEIEIKTNTKEVSQAAKSAADTLSFSEESADMAAAETAQVDTDVVTVYATEELKFFDEEIPVQYTDDLSLLASMEQTDHSYVCQNGRVYYRRYHEDSFEECALSASYMPTADTDKELVCMDADGKETVLFPDKGYGDIYLIGERFYMTEEITEKKDDSNYISFKLYSVDMQGQNRIDYGDGKVYAADMDRGVLILGMQQQDTWIKAYYALDCASGEKTPLTFAGCDYLIFWDYCDGWCYFDASDLQEDNGICQVAAVSLEGAQREIIALTSDNNQKNTLDGRHYYYSYREDICEMEVWEDRIYIVFGCYAGTGHFYQGGKIITIKTDGSDYRAVECFADSYYIRHDAGRPLVYFPHYATDDRRNGREEKEYETSVWDVEGNALFPSDFPRRIFDEHYINASHLFILKEEGTNVYALPDDSGRIVRVAAQLEGYIVQRGEGEADYIAYQHLYYADGFLYFEVEFNIYDKEVSSGWRDGYRRFQTDVYRLKLDENAIELLYSY